MPEALLRTFARSAYHHLAFRLTGDYRPDYFDLHDTRRVNKLLARHGVALLTADPAQASAGRAGAIRFVLATLAARPDLRTRFRRPLTGDGPLSFRHWLATNGGKQLGLSPAGVAEVVNVFGPDTGRRAGRVFDLRPDLRSSFPFGPTPRGREAYLTWFLRFGAAEHKVSPEEFLWHLSEIDESPDRGLALAYQYQPDWQAAVPHALTPFGWAVFVAFLRTTHRVRGRWLDRVRRPDSLSPWDDVRLLLQSRPEWNVTFPHAAAQEKDGDGVFEWLEARPNLPPAPREWHDGLRQEIEGGIAAKPGVNVLGFFLYPSGLQEVTRSLVRAVEASGVSVRTRNLPVGSKVDFPDPAPHRAVEVDGTTIYCAAVHNFIDDYYAKAGLCRRPGVHRVAVWYWELEDLPAEWGPKLALADEVWAPTRFIADAFRKHVGRPVVPMLPGVELPPFAPRPRSHFGLRDDRFTFLFSFDIGSVMARKNPLAVLAAFRKAFGPTDAVQLCIKASHGDAMPADRDVLRAVCAEAGAVLIDRVLPRDETLALFDAADCYVSLHRSEGLGLGMAETMLLGKPVIATGYSGNLDFMTPANSLLVDYTKVPLPAGLPPYPEGCLWADPSVDHAAARMRWVFENRYAAKRIGAKAKGELSDLLSTAAYSRRVRARLDAITKQNAAATPA